MLDNFYRPPESALASEAEQVHTISKEGGYSVPNAWWQPNAHKPLAQQCSTGLPSQLPLGGL